MSFPLLAVFVVLVALIVLFAFYLVKTACTATPAIDPPRRLHGERVEDRIRARGYTRDSALEPLLPCPGGASPRRGAAQLHEGAQAAGVRTPKPSATVDAAAIALHSPGALLVSAELL